MNPGTSEMHFVAALDAVPEMRGVLALFEGVATGAADGYARMADRPAATLLHLGPGLGNGLANLHNARKAPHARGEHRRRPRHLPQAVRRAARVRHRDRRAQRVDAGSAGRPQHRRRRQPTPPTRSRPRSARRGRSPRWSCPPTSRGATAASRRQPRRRPPRDRRSTTRSSHDRRGPRARASRPRCSSAGRACREPRAAPPPAAIADATGAKLLAETFPARLERGAGRVPVDRLAYLAEFAAMQLDGLRHLVLVDAKAPVSFFAYPDKASDLVPEGCEVHVLGRTADDVAGAPRPRWPTRSVRDRAARRRQAPRRPSCRPAPLTADAVCAALGALLPEGAIVSDEGNTSGLFAAGATAGAPPARLAVPHRRRHRPGPAGRGRCRGRVPRPARDRAPGRRQRDVHAPVAVDDGARGPRRHDDPVQQPLLRGAQHGARPGRRRAPPAPRAKAMLDSARPRPRLRRPGARAWACPPPAATTCRGIQRPARRVLATPGRRSSKRSCLPSSEPAEPRVVAALLPGRAMTLAAAA